MRRGRARCQLRRHSCNCNLVDWMRSRNHRTYKITALRAEAGQLLPFTKDYCKFKTAYNTHHNKALARIHAATDYYTAAMGVHV